MEEGKMEEGKMPENHLTSAAAFVEGGIQEACDDACSICLEAFCESDPSTVTGCKHEFHLQCILEWCQRSSHCPMCWQPISLKDPSSQELLDAVEQERNIRTNPSRNTTIFRHPTLGDFELQHLPMSATDADLEERIIQHLAAAAAMGRARHAYSRRGGQRGSSRSSAQGRQHFLVFSNDDPNNSSSPTQRIEGEPASAVRAGGGETSSAVTVEEDPQHLITPPPPSAQADEFSTSASGSSVPAAANNHRTSSHNHRSPPTQSSPSSQDRAGPSDFHTFSESLKSRFSAVSMRYRESITKSTRSWKEKIFSRNSPMADIGSEVRREVNAGIANVSRMMERLETRDNSGNDTTASISSNLEDSAVPHPGNQHSVSNPSSENKIQASSATSSAST